MRTTTLVIQNPGMDKKWTRGKEKERKGMGASQESELREGFPREEKESRRERERNG